MLTSEHSFDEANETMRPALRYIQPPQAIKKRKPRTVISVDQIRNLIDNIVTSAPGYHKKKLLLFITKLSKYKRGQRITKSA
ncbi:MAG: hypothetical protein ACNYPI_03140 [Arenicellales bacterium WSBS_2016_MAG_OTU3]